MERPPSHGWSGDQRCHAVVLRLSRHFVRKNTNFSKEEIEYETLGKMNLLDRCVKETQRLYPATIRIDRVAQKDTNIKDIHVKKGWTVSYSVYHLHHDPSVWPDHTEFKPERFVELTEEQNDSFFPFGNGPRSCVAARLALLEIKMLAVCILRNFRFVKCEETLFPMKLHKTMVMQPAIPIKLRLEKRI